MPYPTIGAPAPWPAGLTTQDGAPLALSSLRGKHVLLYFYPKDDTPGCTIEACNFRDHGTELPGLVVLGASIDDAASHRAFKAKFNLPFDLVVDPKRELAAAYGVLPDGVPPESAKTARSSFLIAPDGRLKELWPKVDAKTHWLDVQRALVG
ncbi:peroxiredoxin [Planctomycetota bacterium]|nr:peroxiredoxin [Planctomycetota bacterium]